MLLLYLTLFNVRSNDIGESNYGHFNNKWS